MVGCQLRLKLSVFLPAMNLLRLAGFLLLSAVASAQTAALSSDTNSLTGAGGTVVLTASASYEGEPGAVGWSIELPADWTLVSVGGPNVPEIKPDDGTTGTLEFAYLAVPAQRAQFTVVVRYPANAKTASARPTVLIRSSGKLNTLTPAAVVLRSQGETGS
jgi:hypothetical protein